MIKYIFFDGDDTLWNNEGYFRESEAAFAELLKEYASEQVVVNTLYDREIENIPIFGYGIKNMVISMIETINLILPTPNVRDLVKAAIEIGKEQWQKPPLLRKGAVEILQQLQRSGKYKLILTTKGEANEQIRKVKRCSLEHYFDHIEVMLDKQLQDYEALMCKLGCSADEIVAIGNSLKSDVLPLIELGAHAIHVPAEITWRYEKVDEVKSSEQMHYAFDLDDCRRVLAQDLGVDIEYEKEAKKLVVNDISIDDYSYPLPDERIAKYPLSQRDHSKLLHYKEGVIEEYHFYDIPELIDSKSLLVYNNTKVIHARFKFFKSSGAQIEIFCLEPELPNDYNLVFQTNKKCVWHCLIGNMKRWKDGELEQVLAVNGNALHLKAKRLDEDNNAPSHLVEFSWDNENVLFSDILAQFGELPIPPYLNRETEESDNQTYQTVYSHIDGSVAAPTAGLHFTLDILRKLALRGVKEQEITLHVGAGTFKPVKSKTIGEHPMHREIISLRLSAIKNIYDHLGNIVAVGTTSVRTLESLYYIGLHIMDNPDNPQLSVTQWEPYQTSSDVTIEQSIGAIIEWMEARKLFVLTAHTSILIAPSFEFKVVNRMITNFHQPKSTLLLLIAAFVGDSNWRTIYKYALSHDFRFLSYGDSSLLDRICDE